MARGVRRIDTEAAVEDLKHRTLPAIPGEVARLVYLASTRDYNTGHYYHDGLAFSFTEEVAGMALAACHQEVFERLAFTSLEELVQHLDHYVTSTGPPREVLETWTKLEPYRVALPLDCDPLSAKLFLSNLRTALAILAARHETGLRGQ